MSEVRTKAPIVRLGEIAKIVSGGTPSRANPAYWGGDIPWVKTANIRDGSLDLDDIDERITSAGLGSSSARVIPAGTILMAMYGQGGTRGRVSVLGTDAAINQACAAIMLHADVDRDYVFQALLSRYAEIRRLSNIGSQENLSADLLREIKLPLPGLDEQRRIAGVLAVWDSAIDTAERLGRATGTRSRWLATRLVGKVQKRADTILLGDIADLQMGRTPSRDVPEYWAGSEDQDSETWLSVSDLLGGGVVTESRERITARAVRECSMKWVAAGTLLMSFKLTIGRVAVAGTPLFTNEAIVALTPKGDSFDARFLYHLLPLLHWDALGNQAAKGKTLNREGLQTIRLPRVPLAEQAGIAKRLDEASRESELLKRAAEAYRAQKMAISSTLLSMNGGDN